MKWRWRLAEFFTYPLAKFVLGLKVSGREQLVPGGQIIAANHSSNFDPLILGWAAGREVYFLAKEELFRYRPFAWLIKSWNALPVGRGGIDIRAIRSCGKVLKRKQTLVLFPEGTRSKNGKIGTFKFGVGMLAVMNRVPVVPARIFGIAQSIVSYWVDRDFVRKGLRQKPKRWGRIEVRFGFPVFPDDYENNRSGYERLTAEVFRRLCALGENLPLCQR
ncbi:MAG: lysophospholipid acyltransferase family protein [bacterium]